MDSAKGDRRDAVARGDSVSGSPAALIKGFSYTRGGHVISSGQKMDASGSTKTCVLETHLKGVCGETVKQSVIQSEKAAADRMKRRGPHHPPKRDFLLLRVGSMWRALCPDEVSFNMEYNAMLQDSWGPPAPPRGPLHSAEVLIQSTGDGHRRRSKTCVPILDKVKVDECPPKEDLFNV
ncbi:uncharacterized protein fbxw10 [Oryzias melastigma]|uniref:uncharacterized protein fbxw10 n=1 Tax=Oryzias melastigma TaxID=30732 RepID=UPI00168D3362|nr:uncharacterized protein fbxw10 [Oryzias melastigma]